MDNGTGSFHVRHAWALETSESTTGKDSGRDWSMLCTSCLLPGAKARPCHGYSARAPCDG